MSKDERKTYTTCEWTGRQGHKDCSACTCMYCTITTLLQRAISIFPLHAPLSSHKTLAHVHAWPWPHLVTGSDCSHSTYYVQRSTLENGRFIAAVIQVYLCLYNSKKDFIQSAIESPGLHAHTHRSYKCKDNAKTKQ